MCRPKCGGASCRTRCLSLRRSGGAVPGHSPNFGISELGKALANQAARAVQEVQYRAEDRPCAEHCTVRDSPLSCLAVSGFTFYETLRIAVPGFLGLAALDLLLRLSFGPQGLEPDGGVEAVTDLIESTFGGVIGSLLLGLLLYLIDLGEKTRIYREGDWRHGFRVPSDTLGVHLAGTPMALRQNAPPTYFLLSDRYLPESYHRRVYLFGSLYRVFVDLRVLLGLTGIGGLGLIIALHTVNSSGQVGPRPNAIWPVFTALASLVLVGGGGTAVYVATVRRSDSQEGLLRRVWRETASVGPLSIALVVLSAIAVRLLSMKAPTGTAAGVLLAAAVVLMWIWVEIGPPQPATSRELRSFIFRQLGASHPDTQYTPLQRAIVDLAFFLPWVSGASYANGQGGVSNVAIYGWIIVITLATAVMAVRKHERRLLYTYETQSLWLDLHAADLQTLKSRGALPDAWG